jgi:hypothetical protein
MTSEAPSLFDIQPDDGLAFRCDCCGRMKHRGMFRKDPDAPRRRLCRLYGDLLTMYGITCAEFYARYDEQDGKCAIGGEPFPSKAEIDDGGVRAQRGPVVDHDHDCTHAAPSGIRGPKRSCRACVRALLCPSCNTMEGLILAARRDPRWQRVIEYQDEWTRHLDDRRVGP